MAKTTKQPVLLVILDGWGISPQKEGNATLMADIPFFYSLVKNYPSATLSAASESVGLMLGEVGNSEVGHLNIGAGRVVWQDLAKITRSIEDKAFFKNPELLELLQYVGDENKKLHLVGLVSDGGVHSHINHLAALLKLCAQLKIKSIFLHLICDGRDSPPKNTKKYLAKLAEPLKKSGTKIATVSGRYYAMDRDKRWDRTQKAFRAIVGGEGKKAYSAEKAIDSAYAGGESDEFIIPTVIFGSEQTSPGKIENGDGIIFFNFRADRMRQLVDSILDPDFKEFSKRANPKNLKVITMTAYAKEKKWPQAVALLKPTNFKHVLAEAISSHNLKQLHIAETEKYAHVTYFFNGGREKPFPGEDRILVPSPRVATYDLKPEMSADGVYKKLIANLTKYDFIVVNFANPDMVGHTGNMKAGIKAVEITNNYLEQIITKTLPQNISVVIIADHGNVEQMTNPDGGINKEHTINPVPFILVRANNKLAQEKDLNLFLNQPPVGVLADVAPTILDIMNIEKPVEMTGQSLAGSI